MHVENPREGRNESQAEVEDDITEITSAVIEMALRNMNEEWESYGTSQLTCRSVDEFGKNWSEFSEGSIELDH